MMDNTEEIIESLDEMTVNYKHLFKKYDDIILTIEKSKKDFQTMKKAYAKLLSEDTSSTLEEVEKEHKKIYFENHFKLESNEKESDKSVNSLEEITSKYEILKEEVERLKNFIDNDGWFLRTIGNIKIQASYSYRSNCSAMTDIGNRFGKWSEKITDYGYGIGYITYTSTLEYGNGWDWTVDKEFSIYTKKSLLNKFPYLNNQLNKFVGLFPEYSNLLFYTTAKYPQSVNNFIKDRSDVGIHLEEP